MKIGLIKLYEVDADKQAEHGDYSGMFKRLMSLPSDGSGNGETQAQGDDIQKDDIEWRTYDARNGEYPQSPDECDGWLLTGSRSGVYEDLPWIPPLLEFIRKMHEMKRPMVGVCFGHQAIAQALGGEVVKSDKGWGAGRQSWSVCGDSAWLRPRLKRLRLLASHQDQVVKLPSDAVVLAESEFCPYAMYSIGSHIFCMQGHPEFTPAYSLMLLSAREDMMPAETWNTARESAVLPNDQRVCAEWMVRFFSQDRHNSAHV